MLALVASNPLLTGIALGVVLGLPHPFMDAALSETVAALTVAVIAGIYIGFAIIDGRARVVLSESFAAAFFAIAALGGLMFSSWLIVGALFLHGVWDWLHGHPGDSLTTLPVWYPPFCLAVDWTLALFLVAALL